MRNVVPDQLWIGHTADMSDLSRLWDAGIEAVVDLAVNEKPAQMPHEMIYCRFPLVDGGGNSPALLRAAVDGVQSLLGKGIPTLVVCSAGMSRSLAVASVAWARLRGEKPEELLVALASGQPHDVSPVLWSDIGKACGEE